MKLIEIWMFNLCKYSWQSLFLIKFQNLFWEIQDDSDRLLQTLWGTQLSSLNEDIYLLRFM
uniref:Uncharacterized protein n=1 Tax=Rhizophora mucronata TaxID=61149 RepID=A0A2P2P352_RHIMU